MSGALHDLFEICRRNLSARNIDGRLCAFTGHGVPADLILSYGLANPLVPKSLSLGSIRSFAERALW
jgi:hypothetical protein